jgi:Uma2 family endonuclease
MNAGFNPRSITVAEYLSGEETQQRQELVWGVVREAPGASAYGHQGPVTDLVVLLHRHVREQKLGRVLVSPTDVVLDEKKALILQPDIIFVSTDRLHIIRDRVWGAPDLAIEVLSPGTRRYDRTEKLGWFREYGVRECWLVEPRTREIAVHVLELPAADVQVFTASDTLRSHVLPDLQLRVADAFVT